VLNRRPPDHDIANGQLRCETTSRAGADHKFDRLERADEILGLNRELCLAGDAPGVTSMVRVSAKTRTLVTRAKIRASPTWRGMRLAAGSFSD